MSEWSSALLPKATFDMQTQMQMQMDETDE
jgi:hypothetical protein